MLRTPFLSLVVLALLAAPVGFAANQIGDNSVKIDTLLSDADVASIQGLKNWPRVGVTLTKAATPEVFVSLARVPGLQELYIASDNSIIQDFSPAASLPGLRFFHAHDFEPADGKPVSLAPLASCSELTTVSFQATPVTDINALAACRKLREVKLYMSDVDSLDFLSSTPELRVLDLYGFKHTFPGYEPVGRLAKLRELNIYMNKQATDQGLSVLKPLTSLRVMRMANCKQVGSLDFLSNCIELEKLHAKWATNLADIGALARMPYLVEVDVADAPIADLAPLAGKIYLSDLDVSGTKVTDLSALSGSAHLQRLNLSETAVTDLSPLVGMRVMEHLDISKTPVADLAPLKNMRALTTLELDGTKVTDLAPLHDLEKLRRITLSRAVPEAQIEALKAALPRLTVAFK